MSLERKQQPEFNYEPRTEEISEPLDIRKSMLEARKQLTRSQTSNFGENNQVTTDFSVANKDQQDIVFEDRRILITPLDEDLVEYMNIMAKSGLRSLNIFEVDTDNKEVLLEIPREARTLRQVILSSESPNSPKSEIFRNLGESIVAIIDATGKIPQKQDIQLDRVLFSRMENKAIFVPPVRFEEYSNDALSQLGEEVEEQTRDPYTHFASQVLVKAFLEGVKK